MKKIVAIYGESGSGKSAIKKAILSKRDDLHEVVTSTTRPMREKERDGVDYFYYHPMAMAKKIYDGEMAECVIFNNWVYGTEYNKLAEDKINIGVWNPEGVETLNDDGTIECLNIYISTPAKIRLLRSLYREEEPDVEEIIRRYAADKKDFRDAEIDYKTTIVNDGSKTVSQIADEVIKVIDQRMGKFD